MRAETQAVVDEIRQSLTLLRRHLDWDNALKRLEELNALAEDPQIWDDPHEAQKLMRERSNLEDKIERVRGLEQRIDDALTLYELGATEEDEDSIKEAHEQLVQIKAETDKQETESLLSGEADANDCYLEVNAGAGGTEAQDWAQMLVRMYTRWAEAKGYKIEWVEESEGEEAGLKSATMVIRGPNAFGWLKTEAGVHRLVRISPFDSQARRHTSFASVWVYPVIDDTIEIEILDKDLRVDTYRASGAGGQHVNKTDSAVRMTHLPTGIVVQCQNDRSQHKNRATAMSMLRARLYEHELRKREEAAEAEAATKTDIGWGHQIRSYVLQPYQMIKDLRTGVEKGNAQGVLDGDLDDFLEASLAYHLDRGSQRSEQETA
ncbi:peptide chain release factor 2 [Fodinicurvata halophila]|uniref:Peptide chain release factor 2 n=1 Tax=Fodinicurvata halophila TaxID=1419723 RepID=A0ABV8UI30_9PROT